MTNFKTKLTTAIATGAVLLQAMAPVTLAANTIEISDNGAGSGNTATVTQTSTTTVNQTNNAIVTNNVEADADTGDNDANFNTGGNVTVDTGDAEATANVTNNLNTNVAQVDCCGAQDTDILVSGNGAFSDNAVTYTNRNTTTLDQRNVADVYNDVHVDADSGDNDANFNTGDGNVVVNTGKATAGATVSTTANANWAHVGSDGDDSSDVSLRILDNGAGSDNAISATLANTTDLDQRNRAEVDNNVEADADTGDNDANYNTGDGDVVIDTGDATANADVDTSVNFNAADVDCGCVFGLTAKISGNGAAGELQSENENSIRATLSSTQLYGQANNADVDNDLDGRHGVEAETGNNEASSNTSGSDTDPSVNTGDADVEANVSTSGNTNILGDVDFPELPEMELDWDFSGMWHWFGMMMHS